MGFAPTYGHVAPAEQEGGRKSTKDRTLPNERIACRALAACPDYSLRSEEKLPTARMPLSDTEKASGLSG